MKFNETFLMFRVEQLIYIAKRTSFIRSTLIEILKKQSEKLWFRYEWTGRNTEEQDIRLISWMCGSL
jgi:hypothetical protein